mgnify:CR=1 FL=1
MRRTITPEPSPFDSYLRFREDPSSSPFCAPGFPKKNLLKSSKGSTVVTVFVTLTLTDLECTLAIALANPCTAPVPLTLAEIFTDLDLTLLIALIRALTAPVPLTLAVTLTDFP